MRLIYILSAVSCLMLFGCGSPTIPKVLVFSKTAGFRHDCIETATDTLRKMGRDQRFQVEATEDAAAFNEQNLKRFSAVVFLCTTGDVLNETQQLHFERFIQAGGGYVGIHSASDTEYEWPWYGKMVGAYFASHPEQQKANLNVLDHKHESTAHLGDTWTRFDEWYDFKVAPKGVNLLLNIDEKSYKNGKMGDHHPMAWYHEYDGGRAFYTALGHTKESYSEPEFMKHVLGGIRYAIGSGKLDYSKVTFQIPPTDDRFTTETLAEGLNEPMEMGIRANGDVWFVERKGDLKAFEQETGVVRTIHHFNVHTVHEDGLMGMVFDPKFEENGWLYLMYSPVGDEPVQYVSRFWYDGYDIDTTSEKVVLKIPVQRKECCHSAGCLRFDQYGHLWISVGDNTNPFASDGYAPIDEQANRSEWDAQKSSGNTNDLRGKILRIKPLDDGTYEIPKGNLFADSKQGRPEIYVMGCRNPFRFMIDSETDYVYWGEVGPDAAKDSTNRGPRGHDEVNQAKKPGFFGWPYFVGNNKPYHDYDFKGKKSGNTFDPKKPLNNSPNNTGATNLPPATPAFIWYPYGKSEEFPMTAEGGRNAMAGPIFHRNDFGENVSTFPNYFEGKLLIYDWMRNWVFAVTMDKDGNYRRMDRMFSHIKFNNPMDMQFGKDGALYVLQYGTGWFLRNDDARLVRIKYNPANRPPQADIVADVTQGAAPLTVKLSSDSCRDFDGDQLRYTWHIPGQRYPNYEKNPTATFNNPGIYHIELEVKDIKGNITKAKKTIEVGNSVPVVNINMRGNQTFFFDNGSLDYDVNVMDMEDGSTEGGILGDDDVEVTCDFLAMGFDKVQSAMGHQLNTGKSDKPMLSPAEQLMAGSDCGSCHAVDREINGPTYKAIADRYNGKPGAVAKLATKILKGGNGAWGERAMSAHPQLKQADAEVMVQWILALSGPADKAQKDLPLRGLFAFNKHKPNDANGTYIFRAHYRDHGAANVSPIERIKEIMLRSPIVQAEAKDTASLNYGEHEADGAKFVVGMTHYNFIGYKQIDLTGIKKVTVMVGLSPKETVGGIIEMHLGGVDGPMIGSVQVPSVTTQTAKQLDIPIKATKGKHHVFFVFKNTENPGIVAAVDWFRFWN